MRDSVAVELAPEPQLAPKVFCTAAAAVSSCWGNGRHALTTCTKKLNTSPFYYFLQINVLLLYSLPN